MSRNRNSLGLKKGEILVRAHDPQWLFDGKKIADEIRNRAGNLIEDIQHVGSTSIPELLAKPILDFVVGVKEMGELDGVLSLLVDMGYINRGRGLGSVGHLLVYEIADRVRTQHIHIVEYESEHWKHYVHFRDHMKRNKKDMMRLRDLKESLIARTVERKEYQEKKSRFVDEIWAKIQA